MPMFGPEETFTVNPKRLAVGNEALGSRWSIYVVRIDLSRHDQDPAMKIGMVGTGTIGERIKAHERRYGPTQLLDAWTLEHAVSHLEVDQRWRLVEQYEARLQFAPEFIDPSARHRRLRPDSLVYSYEWFEVNDRILQAVALFASNPVTLPHGWTLADASQKPERLGETP